MCGDHCTGRADVCRAGTSIGVTVCIRVCVRVGADTGVGVGAEAGVHIVDMLGNSHIFVGYIFDLIHICWASF